MPFLPLSIHLPVPSRAHTVVLGGDVMLNGIRPGSGPLKGVAGVLCGADFALVNLEVPLTNARRPTAAKTAAELKARSQFVLKADPRHVAALRNAGIDAVTLANNHAMDYGARGLREMRTALDKAGIRYAGAGDTADRASVPTILVAKDGFRVGLLGALCFVGRGALKKCTPARTDAAGVNVLAFDGRLDKAAQAKLCRWVGAARARCDYLVIAVHWGVERQTKPTAYQKELGKALLAAGADVVWGAHPHVLQPYERTKQGLVLYSTGNLVSALPGRTALFRLTVGPHRTAAIQSIPVTILSGKAVLSSAAARPKSAGRILNKPSRP